MKFVKGGLTRVEPCFYMSRNEMWLPDVQVKVNRPALQRRLLELQEPFIAWCRSMALDSAELRVAHHEALKGRDAGTYERYGSLLLQWFNSGGLSVYLVLTSKHGGNDELQFDLGWAKADGEFVFVLDEVVKEAR